MRGDANRGPEVTWFGCTALNVWFTRNSFENTRNCSHVVGRAFEFNDISPESEKRRLLGLFYIDVCALAPKCASEAFRDLGVLDPDLSLEFSD